MTSEIFNFIQAQPQTQTQAQGQVKGTSQNANNSGAEPGLFDSLMNEYANINQDSEQQVNQVNLTLNINLNQEQQVIITSGNNTLSQAGLDILAGVKKDSEGHEVFIPERYMMNQQPQDGIKATEAFIAQDTGDLVARIMGDKDIAAKIAALPDDKLQEVSKILEVIQNSESESEINTGLEKLFALISETNEDNNISQAVNLPDDETEIKTDGNKDFAHEIDSKPSREINAPEDSPLSSKESDSQDEKDDEKPEDNSLIQENVNNFAGFAQVQGDNTKPVNDAKPDDITVNKDAPRHTPQTRLTRNNNEAVKSNPDDVPEKSNESKTDSRFANVLNDEEENGNENENTSSHYNNRDSQSNQDNQEKNFSQSREDFAASRNSSRSRNDTRRVSNSTQSQTDFTANARRTESHSNFQSFFEDVLSSRRTASTPQPLNLRAAYNLNQSETLRDGIVNVVRFIRADGVHKASLIIDPPAIGRISVELTSSTSGVEASIKVASEQIRQLVQDQLTQLRMNLSQQGVQVAEFTVDVQQDNQQNQGQNQNSSQQENTGAVRGLTADDEPEELRVDLQEGLLYWVA